MKTEDSTLESLSDAELMKEAERLGNIVDRAQSHDDEFRNMQTRLREIQEEQYQRRKDHFKQELRKGETHTLADETDAGDVRETPNYADWVLDWILGDYYEPSTEYEGWWNPLHYLDSWILFPGAPPAPTPSVSTPEESVTPDAGQQELPGIGGLGEMEFMPAYRPGTTMEALMAQQLILLEIELFGNYFGEVPFLSSLKALVPTLIRPNAPPVISLGKQLSKEAELAAKVKLEETAQLLRDVRDRVASAHPGASTGKQNVAVGVWTTRSGRQVVEVAIVGMKERDVEIINEIVKDIKLPRGYSIRPAKGVGFKDHAELLLHRDTWIRDSLFGWCSDCLDVISFSEPGTLLVLSRAGGKTKEARKAAEALRKKLVKERKIRHVPGF